ncbi:hypothetical protein AB0H29_16305 [Streptomyces thermolilacinus]
MRVPHGLVAVRRLAGRVLLATGRFHDAPLLVHGVEWPAVAGAAALLNRVDDTLGRTAG